MDPSAPNIQQRVEREQADTLISISPSGLVAAFVLSLGFWVLFYWQTRNPIIFAWAVIIHPIQLTRMVMTRRYLKTPDQERQPQRSANVHVKIIWLSSVVWGLAPWMFFPAGNFPLTTLMMMVIMGLVSAGMASVAPYRPAIAAFTIPMLAGLSTAMLWQRDGMHLFLAACALLFIYTNLNFGFRQNRLLSDALLARYEKESIAQRLEEQLKLVEQASREKTRFFASASHDLRQPLHSLGLFGSALLKRLKETPDEPIVRNLMHCVDALETSFSAMLDVSKLDAGVIEPEIRAVAVSSIFRQLDASFAQQAHSQGLALRFKPGGRYVRADAALLERLLGNLIHNALKFTSHGGIVVVARASRAASDPRIAGQMGVSIEVWDSGMGIAPAEIPRIFDEFYQVGNAERDRSRGLGMGLAIVQRLAILMGLRVKTFSKVGRGTVFKVWLPLANAPRLQEAVLTKPLGAAVHRLEGLRVLVVDDEESVRTSTALALRHYGMHVDAADGLAQAQRLALDLRSAGGQFDVIVSDLRLRDEENGIDLVAQIRQIFGKQIPALLITGDTAPERVRQAQVSGLRVQYKPMKMDALIEEMSLLVGARAGA